ncbi:TRAP transporter substrate-binding protein [Desulfoferrobacter suflitae]|uniref:TRAP transporter substrate-binding protein n=1 Tax=Desulfoferrobacter suflitae TaxID=2865782 RepID=UPI002164511E|nr:TRAP transporter substrate-binding protein [Desulfoferrobacter suflitae]MCK8601188.1 TRAP transporter substrate-binding protein [Desulfoferrobacter suflitae]
MRRFLALLIILWAVAWGNGAAAKTTIRLGLVTIPGSAQNICAEKFKELLEARSDDYEVKIHHSASLGSETEILQQIQMNTVQMGIITDGPFDVFLPEVRVINYPFLFGSYRQVDEVLDGPVGQELLQRLEKVGFKGLAFSENGFRHLTNNKRPVHTVDDVSGLKIRVMESVLHKELWRMLGANPTPMGWPIYTELQQGTIDGQENPLSVIWTYKLSEVQKYLALTGHVYSAHIDVANLQWFEGLPGKDQDLIRQCMIEAARYQRAWNRDNEAAFLDGLKQAGMQVDEQPDLAAFRSKVANIRQLEIYQGPATRQLLQKFLEAAGQ